jgi:hypothetical protein
MLFLALCMYDYSFRAIRSNTRTNVIPTEYETYINVENNVNLSPIPWSNKTCRK